MRKLIIIIFSIVLVGIISFSGCEQFEPKPETKLTLDISASLLVEPASVYDVAVIMIEYDPFIMSDFASQTLFRRAINNEDWTKIFDSKDPYETTFTDSVGEDDDLIYKLEIKNTDNGIISDLDTVTNVNLTKFNISKTGNTPLSPYFISFTDLSSAIESNFVDDGDTLDFVDDTVKTVAWILEDKNLHYRGNPTVLFQGNGEQPMVTLNNGILENFYITGGYLERNRGVGVVVDGNGILRRCSIYGNSTNYGSGSGLIVSGNGQVTNCLIYGNYTRPVVLSGLLNGTFINNTIYDQDIELSLNNGNITFLNNIFSNGSFTFESEESTSNIAYNLYFSVDTANGFPGGENNIFLDPLFEDLQTFILKNDSPALNSGDPDPYYNNQDNTRNTLGFQGGPYGLSQFE